MPSGTVVKTDMERVGVFKEMSYISIGDRYTSPSNRPFNESAYRSRQMAAGGARRRAAPSGFLDKSFKRIFEREAFTDPQRLERLNRIQQARRNLGKAFVPCNAARTPCGSGTYFGTLSGPLEAMSPLAVTQKPRRSPGRNVVTSPPKKGSGYSFPNVTLGKVHLYAADRYDRDREVQQKEAAIHRSKILAGPFRLHLHPADFFQGNPYRSDRPRPPSHKPRPPGPQKVQAVPFKPSSPSKKVGGMKAGTFSPYPSHSAEPYGVRRARPVQAEPGRARPVQAGPGRARPVQAEPFRPGPGPKSVPVKSIITVNVNRSVHSANYTSVSPTVIF